MAQISILMATAFLAFFSWGWFAKWFQHQPSGSESIKIEEQLKVDPAFDAELNSLNQEMTSAEADARAELDVLEKE